MVAVVVSVGVVVLMVLNGGAVVVVAAGLQCPILMTGAGRGSGPYPSASFLVDEISLLLSSCQPRATVARVRGMTGSYSWTSTLNLQGTNPRMKTIKLRI